MTTNNLALYRLLMKFGASAEEAESAAAVDVSALATKADLHIALAEFEARLAWKIGGLIVGALISMTGLFAIIVNWVIKR